ncbi:MAG: hypothetical protein LBT71_03285 [Azoarcus sp.]|jgi:hypothetical protein|nr:hypothetical protein [Azoarcus sp.]
MTKAKKRRVAFESVYVPKEQRYWVDIGNDRPYDWDIVLLSKTDEVEGFDGKMKTIKEGEYIYLFTDIGDGEFCFVEGIVIKNPYADIPVCKWCCEIVGEIEYDKDYEARFAAGDRVI